MQRFNRKRALVTGGASGIGRETARQLAAEGCRVVIADVNETGARAVAEEVGPSCSAIVLDVSREEAWQAAMDHVRERLGGLDILVNCAGIGVADPFEDMALDSWNAMLAVNLTGVVLGCQHAIRIMKDNITPAAIVNISSVGGLVGGEDIAGYCATKGGVTLLTRSLALYCAGKDYPIRCNSVHPTYVDTEMLDPVAAAFPSREEMIALMAAQVPLGRVATPADVAAAILFLASEEAAMVNGHQMLVDGGQLAGLPAQHTV
ncbi:SDR family NAD(P)-dependent oxidoreductase [Luteithermobacter gelatinilyticus]|uniref:SDR family NAD(P)-dependent oxidoreductase n=1 Tax=Luteithermobacter gelatinilyticus TaxID=2582913 RepID=UPI001106BF34|nr:glucose 1-dehydrogenase [Luteithermobacter gelatinilyticus]